MRKVEMSTAFSWWCEDCGELNFALPRKSELTDEEAEEAFRAFHDLEDWAELPEGWRQFELVQIPPIVKCSKCDSQFEGENETHG